jgi:hypothetical protein
MTSDIQNAAAAGENIVLPAKEPTSPMHDNLQWSEKLRDGTMVLIRAIRDDDAELERRFIENCRRSRVVFASLVTSRVRIPNC